MTLRRNLRRRGKSVSAFSLVEVVLAIGIITFGITVLIGLIPVGLKSNRDSTEESQAVNLLYALISDRRASAYSLDSSTYSLPAIASVTNRSTGTLYTTEEGTVTTNQDQARYRVSYTIYPESGARRPVLMALKVSWPALQTNQAASVETLATFMPQ